MSPGYAVSLDYLYKSVVRLLNDRQKLKPIEVNLDKQKPGYPLFADELIKRELMM